MKATGTLSCVYFHIRPDTGCVFYIGKGTIGRAKDLRNNRNKKHQAICALLNEIKLKAEVRIVAHNLSEDEAYALEIQYISEFRASGIALANISPGGSGAPKGNQYRRGAILSDETKNKIGAANRGKVWTKDERDRLSEACSGERNGFFGKSHREVARLAIAEANRRRDWTPEARAKHSMAMKGKTCGKRKPWKHTEESKKNYSIAAKRRWALRKAKDAIF